MSNKACLSDDQIRCLNDIRQQLDAIQEPVDLGWGLWSMMINDLLSPDGIFRKADFDQVVSEARKYCEEFRH